MKQIRIGTCSFNYPSWQGIVYSRAKDINFLKEYSQHFDSVEIDRWFWSLFNREKAVLPDPRVVREYLESTPDDFRFSVKVPNSITLTHFYSKGTRGMLEQNPFFLSSSVYEDFLEILEPLAKKIDTLIFQFEYLNQQKMRDGKEFIGQIGSFFQKVPRNLPAAVEVRNSKYLTRPYFEFLRHMDLAHVFLQGYWMPAITDLYDRFADLTGSRAVIRLMGEDRKGIEKLTGKKWDKIVLEKDEEIRSIAGTIRSMLDRNTFVTVNVNNHYQGSAPLTISRLRAALDEKSVSGP